MVLVFAIAWQLVATHTASILPPLGSVAADLWQRPAFYLANLLVTLRAALSGFAAGVVCAIILAVLVDAFDAARSAVMPAALLLNVTPIIAIAPALIVAFGFGPTPHIIVAGIAAFFPMLISAVAGLASADPQTREILACMAASRLDVAWHLKLPASVPLLLSGARLSLSAALVGAVVSEFTGTSHGLGAAIVTATMFLNLKQMWAAIFVSAVSSVVLIGGVGVLERRIAWWQIPGG